MAKKMVVILGPTAAGKSDMAVNLSQKFNGEVVSADSRQVYRGMNIGTGKITKEEMRGIPHYCIDVVSPKTKFTVTQYRKLALKAIDKIFKNGKLPILCGGTGFYIQAVVDGIIIPQIKPDWQLRKKLEKKTTKELYQMLQKSDPRRAGNIDKNNPRRLIRAVEIVMKTKKPVPLLKKNPLPYPVLMIGINKKPKIKERVEQMLKLGLEKEAKQFSDKEIIGYQEWSSDNPKDLIILHTKQYAKKQMTW
ncbi:MAG: tRNA (adenosine(37)-N6)-dimethylallyltransferase MiaA, partial [Candidatus Nealsonbacteria bacterium]